MDQEHVINVEQRQALDMVETEQREAFLYAVSRRENLDATTEQLRASIPQFTSSAIYIAAKGAFWRRLGWAVLLTGAGTATLLVSLAVR